MTKLVTVGIPVYKRLDYLPQVLEAVALQDYPDIELLVSDNGMNGPEITELLDQHYCRPYRFRRNSASVSMAAHFNQIVEEASGDYFMLLCDDDEISPNYVSELVSILEGNPHVSVALSRLEVVDLSGRTVKSSDEQGFPPHILSGEDFIRAWSLGEYDFVCFVTNLARTDDIRTCGGYPDFPSGNSVDDALLIKLCLNSHVAFTQRCTFRYRVYEASHGLSASYQDLVEATKQFLGFLDTDPKILEFAQARPERWAELKRCLVGMSWTMCHDRWARMYRKRLPPVQWARAALAMPFIPAYYGAVISTLLRAAIPKHVKRRLKSLRWRLQGGLR